MSLNPPQPTGSPGIEWAGSSASPRPTLGASLYVAVLMLVVVFFGLIRFRLLEMPLERDEGEYAYSGQLLLQGIPPYKLAYNMKLPGIYAAYAAMLAVFGETPAGIHAGLLLINAATTLLMCFLTARLFGRLAGIVAASSYALLSTSSSVMGFEAHATHFVALLALAGIQLLLMALQFRRPWLFLLSGILSGTAVLMKQHGIFFVLFCFLYLVWSEWRRSSGSEAVLQHAGVFAIGVILPYVAVCLALYKAGVFGEFWFWTVSYAGEYSKMGWHRAVRAFLENSRAVASPAAPVWILAALGMSAPFWNPGVRRQAIFLLGFFLCSFLALCPGAYFRPHYFILLLPAAAMLVGVAVSSAAQEMALSRKYASLAIIPVLVFAASFGYAVLHQRKSYFSMEPVAVFQTTYPDSPFLAAVRVADYIREHSPATGRIAVLGSEPEIYFHARRHSATGYLYMYSLVVRQKYTARMREDMIRELETNRPEYIVYVDVWDSWGERQGGPELAAFLSRLQELMDQGYDKVGIADIGGTTSDVWGDAVRGYVPHSPNVIYVLRRKQPVPGLSLARPARFLGNAILRLGNYPESSGRTALP